MSEEKNKGGRPTKYRPEMCETVVKMMRVGCSMVEVAAELDCSYDAIYEWRQKHPEFGQAVQRGERLSQAWWEMQGRTNLSSTTFNTPLWSKNMAGRFAKNGWGEKTEMTMRGDPSAPLVVKGIDVVHVAAERQD